MLFQLLIRPRNEVCDKAVHRSIVRVYFGFADVTDRLHLNHLSVCLRHGRRERFLCCLPLVLEQPKFVLQSHHLLEESLLIMKPGTRRFPGRRVAQESRHGRQEQGAQSEHSHCDLYPIVNFTVSCNVCMKRSIFV